MLGQNLRTQPHHAAPGDLCVEICQKRNDQLRVRQAIPSLMAQTGRVEADPRTQSVQFSQKQDGCNIYVIMKTVCRPGYHYNGFVVAYALGHMMYDYLASYAQVLELSHFGDSR